MSLTSCETPVLYRHARRAVGNNQSGMRRLVGRSAQRRTQHHAQVSAIPAPAPRSLLFIAVIALLVYGIGWETLKSRREDLIYLGQQHMFLVVCSMLLSLLVGIPSGILLSRPSPAAGRST